MRPRSRGQRGLEGGAGRDRDARRVQRGKGLRAPEPAVARHHEPGQRADLAVGQRGDGAVLAEKELAHSMAEMALSAPPFRSLRRT